MSDVSLTIRLPKETHRSLEKLAKDLDRSRNYLIKEAVARFLENEAEVVEGIKEAMIESQEGKVVPHDEVMSEIKSVIKRAAAKNRKHG